MQFSVLLPFNGNSVVISILRVTQISETAVLFYFSKEFPRKTCCYFHRSITLDQFNKITLRILADAVPNKLLCQNIYDIRSSVLGYVLSLFFLRVNDKREKKRGNILKRQVRVVRVTIRLTIRENETKEKERDTHIYIYKYKYINIYIYIFNKNALRRRKCKFKRGVKDYKA